MKKLATALDEEKKKTDALLYEMLPVKVANQLREGETVTAGELEVVQLNSLWMERDGIQKKGKLLNTFLFHFSKFRYCHKSHKIQ